MQKVHSPTFRELQLGENCLFAWKRPSWVPGPTKFKLCACRDACICAYTCGVLQLNGVGAIIRGACIVYGMSIGNAFLQDSTDNSCGRRCSQPSTPNLKSRIMTRESRISSISGMVDTHKVHLGQIVPAHLFWVETKTTFSTWESIVEPLSNYWWVNFKDVCTHVRGGNAKTSLHVLSGMEWNMCWVEKSAAFLLIDGEVFLRKLKVANDVSSFAFHPGSRISSIDSIKRRLVQVHISTSAVS